MAYLNNEPEDYARQLLAELNLSRAKNLDDLLIPLRLKVKEVDALDFEGTLVCRKNRAKGIIGIKSNIREEGRKRFTICHEIGHFILPGHGTFSCKSSDIESLKYSINARESEANRFASELLLLAKEVYPLVRQNKATISLAKKISADFETSLTAAALKIVDLSDESCAMVLSVDGKIKWFKRNEKFRYFIQLGNLDEQSLASRLFRDDSIMEDENFVYGETWLTGDNLSSDVKIWEDSIYLSTYNAVLTILTV
jgi:Zn-dependent peptidase ImmA (M78 family)